MDQFGGAASYVGASRIKNKNISNTVAASICSAIGLGTLAAMFLPDLLSNSIDSDQKNLDKKVIDDEKSNEDNKWMDLVRGDVSLQCSTVDVTIYDFGEEIGTRFLASYLPGYKGLISRLEATSPDPKHRAKHNKLIGDSPGPGEKDNRNFDPCFTDNDEGIVLRSNDFQGSDFEKNTQGIHIFINRQGKYSDNREESYKNGCLVLQGYEYNKDLKVESEELSDDKKFEDTVNKFIDTITKGDYSGFYK